MALGGLCKLRTRTGEKENRGEVTIRFFRKRGEAKKKHYRSGITL